MGRARARGVDLILSTVRSLAHGEHREGGHLPTGRMGLERVQAVSPLGMGTIGSQSCRQECGLVLNLCLNLFPCVQTLDLGACY